MSFLTASYRLYAAVALAATAAPPQNLFDLLWMPVTLCLSELAISSYIRGFWDDEKKAPFVEKYYESVSHNMEVMRICDDLACLWAVATGLAYFGY